MFYKIACLIARWFFSVIFLQKVRGKQNIPKEGGFILALNHISNWDPVYAGAACHRRVHFLAKKEIFKNKFLSWFLYKLGAYPVSRGSADIKAVKHVLGLLKDGNGLQLFPEGTRVTDGSNVAAKTGVAMFATRAKVPVIPGAIVSDYKLFRKSYLIFGEPLYFEEYYSIKPDNEMLHEISNSILDKIRFMVKDARDKISKGEKI